MQTQACQPCAKRKVRCDRREPCSNCKRRKQDQCVYTEVTQTERIKQLEALVRDLEARTSSEPSTSRPSESVQAESSATVDSIRAPPARQLQSSGSARGYQRSTNPMLVREGGESVYLESYAIRPSESG